MRLDTTIIRDMTPSESRPEGSHEEAPHAEGTTSGRTATDIVPAMHKELRVLVHFIDPVSFTRTKTGAAFASIYAYQERESRMEVIPVPPATGAY